MAERKKVSRRRPLGRATQNGGKAQENPRHQDGHAQEDQDGQKKAGEEGASLASITQES